MLSQLFFANFHFVITVFEAFIFLTAGWLYFNSWRVSKQTKGDLTRSIGFFLMATVAITHASTVQLPTITLSAQVVKLVALFLIAGGFVVEPILRGPGKKTAVFIPLAVLSGSLVPPSVILLLIISFLYFRKSTIGGARESKPVAFAFLALALSEVINVPLRAPTTSSIVVWSKLLADYGPLWIASHLLGLIGIVVLGLWVWKYLRFKADFQLFVTITTFSLAIFVATTSTFTFLLLKNVEADALVRLKADLGVMRYALDRLEQQALANARAVAKNSSIQEAFLQGENEKLFELASEFMIAQETNFLDIASSSGEVVMRAQDREKGGESLLDYPIFASAIAGEPSVTIEVKQRAIVPEIQIVAADSFTAGTGVVITGFKIDNAFVDGVKKTTGLDTSVYSKDTQVATTFIAPDGKSRFVGTKETDYKILSTVLENGEIYTGSAVILNQPFYAAYAPLKNVESEIVGMLFIGRPQKELFDTVQKSTQSTFTTSVIFILLSIAPAYWISRYIKENIKA